MKTFSAASTPNHSTQHTANIQQDKASATQWLNIIMLWLAGVYAAMQFAKFSTTYDLLLTHYQSSATTISMALSSVGIMGLIFGTIAGVLSGKIGHKNVLLTSLVLGSLLSFIQSFLPSIEYMLISRIFEGLSHLGVVVAAPTLMIAISEKRHQAICMGLWGTFFGVAFALMGWFGQLLLDEGGLARLYQFHSVLITPIFIYLIFFLKTTDAIETSDQTNNALKPNKAEALSLFFNDLAKLYQNPRTLLPGIVFLFHTCMFVALLTFIPRLSPDEGIKNQLYILLPIISILGTFIAGVLAQYYVTPQRLGTIAYLGVALFSGLTFLNIESSSLFFSFASCILLFSGLVAGSAFAMIPHLARSHDEQAKSNGAIAQLGNLGATIGPPVFATGLAQFQSIGMLWMILGLCLIGTTVTLYASRFRPLKINE